MRRFRRLGWVKNLDFIGYFSPWAASHEEPQMQRASSLCQIFLLTGKIWEKHRTIPRSIQKNKILFQIPEVFSGRRGIHCWVLDETARFLDKQARVALANYCQVTVNASAVISANYSLHPMERKSLEIIDEYWDELLTDQGKNIFLKDQLLWSSLTYCMDQT